jgi:hypothetical protein
MFMSLFYGLIPRLSGFGLCARDLANTRFDLSTLPVAGLFVSLVGAGLFSDSAIHYGFLKAAQR